MRVKSTEYDNVELILVEGKKDPKHICLGCYFENINCEELIKNGTVPKCDCSTNHTRIWVKK